MEIENPCESCFFRDECYDFDTCIDRLEYVQYLKEMSEADEQNQS